MEPRRLADLQRHGSACPAGAEGLAFGATTSGWLDWPIGTFVSIVCARSENGTGRTIRGESMPRSNQRVVLVIGASSGIGRACALELARRGNRVYGASRRDPADLADERTSIEKVRMDVDDDASVRAGVRSILEAEGHIDALINCAGFGFGGALEDTSDEELRAILETNVLGTLRTCRAVLPSMRARGGGTIVNVSSIGGRIALPFQGHYSATKFAVEGLSESLRMEAHPFGVRVVLIEPGDFATGFTDARKTVRDGEGDGPYAKAFARALAVVEKDERGGASPASIGRLVARILDARSPRLRYTVGPLFQRFAVRAKSILPSRFFEWGLRKYYHVG